jgi:tRNA (guanine-N(7)-)-methyltransferase subunit TRM82
VSKLCLVPGTDLLVSGGGDDWIGIWDWPNYSLKTSINIKQHLSKYLTATPEDKDPQIAVSGIWAVPIQNRPSGYAVVIACEKVPALLVLTPSNADNNSMQVTMVEQQLQGMYPLDFTFVGQHMLVSIDARSSEQKRVLALQLAANDDGSIAASRDEAHESTLKQLNDLSGIEEDPKSLDNLLYNVKNLKKRTGWGEQAEE